MFVEYNLRSIWLFALGVLLSAVTFPLELRASSHGRCVDNRRPNIILIMVDDLGFSDLGCYGSEIETPNIDALAKAGQRYTQFYNCAKCETTRATLMSGRFHPEVGKTKLTNCMPIAEAMKEAGYETLMTGKWHLAGDPIQRGFERYFGHLSGATNYFTGDDTFRLDKEKFEIPATGFYTTDANTDYAIQFLKERDKDRPFFLYVAYNAPHYPLQAPKEDVLKYRGKYRVGWDSLRESRLERQQKLGLFHGQTISPATRPHDVPAWDSLTAEQQDVQELMMATYAAMIDRVDQNIGRLVNHLKNDNQLDNTLIMFLSDNGACPFQRTKAETRQKKLAPWDPTSYWVYDKGWAHACNAPFREYKQNQHEGGICTPMIAHWPNGISNPGSITHQTGHLVDIMATCTGLAEFAMPTTYLGKPVSEMRGSSLQPIFDGKQREQKQPLYFSFRGKNNALRLGNWKLVNKNFGQFELYDLAQDRTEQIDLAETNPTQFQIMKSKWDQLANEVGQTERKKPKGKGSKK